MITKRKKRIPVLKKTDPPKQDDLDLPKHELRRRELSELYNIPLEDVFVDPKNGLELYRNPKTGGWLTNPKHRGL